MDETPENVHVQDEGTSQERGHALKHGVIFVVTATTGEVLRCSLKT